MNKQARTTSRIGLAACRVGSGPATRLGWLLILSLWLIPTLAGQGLSPGPTPTGPLRLTPSAPPPELPDPEQAFIPSVTVLDPNTLQVTWSISPGTYLYRERLGVELADPDARVTTLALPEGEPKEDEFFGRQQVYYHQVSATAHLDRDSHEARDVDVSLRWQGCADIGVCYPPMEERVSVRLPALAP